MKVYTESTLCWPHGVARTKAREKGKFVTKFAVAYAGVVRELKLLRVTSATISGHLTLRNDGSASAEQTRSADPGVAVRFQRVQRGGLFVVAVDRYDTKTANMQAVRHVLEAFRTIERHGNTHVLAQAVEGFRELVPGRVLALPASPWWRVLGFVERPADIVAVRRAFRAFVRDHGHPDQGGDPDSYASASAALAEAEAEFTGGDP